MRRGNTQKQEAFNKKYALLDAKLDIFICAGAQ
jgi:hypothetical protein